MVFANVFSQPKFESRKRTRWLSARFEVARERWHDVAAIAGILRPVRSLWRLWEAVWARWRAYFNGRRDGVGMTVVGGFWGVGM